MEGNEMSVSEAKTLMTYNGTTGDLICFTPAGENVLQTVEPNSERAHEISNAIQAAYRNGWVIGRLTLLQRAIERRMDELNA